MKNIFHWKLRGETLIELILAMGLAAVIFPALLTGFFTSRDGKVEQTQRLQAISLLKETEQAVRNIRSNGWDTFAVDGTYHTTLNSSVWAFAANSTTINGFTQQVVISDVNRNSNGDVVSSGGIYDPSTKKVTVQISWETPYHSVVSSTIYFTRSISNLANTNTTNTTFNTGTITNTQVTNTAGGEITLANNNKGKWCSPSFSTTSIDLPDGPPVAVAATASATSILTPNDVFVATAPNTSSSIKMAYVNVTADTDSPTATLHGEFTMDSTKYSSGTFPSGTGLDNNFKTNDIKYYKSSGGKLYALLATDLPEKEVVAVQINNGSGDAFQDPTNKIYKYWTYFNTNMYSGASATTGYLSPTANAAETTSAGDNDGYDSNPTRAYASDSSYAVDTSSGSGTGTSCTGTDKDKHRFYNYNVYLPSYAAIAGVEVQLKGKVDSTTGAPKICIQLSSDGGTTWTTAQSTSTLTTTNTTYTLGGSTDTWGRSWSANDFSNTNFRVRVIDVANNTSRSFSLDSIALKVYSNSSGNDEDPFNYGANSIAILGNRGYVTSGGFLYTFDLSNIDSKSTSNPLDEVGCRVELDGYSCKPSSGTDKKYNAGETGGTWSNTTNPAHSDCSDGGNVELYADEDIAPVQVGTNTYVYVAVGAGTDPEFEIANVSTVPTGSTTPTISNSACGTVASGNTNTGWKRISSLDFNPISNTEEAANSVYAKSDGTRAYVSSNGGIDANHDGKADSNQFYVIDTSNKSSPKFLSSNTDNTAKTGYYNGTGANAQMYPRRSLTVQDGVRAVLVGKDGVSDTSDAYEYQVTDMTTEASPTYCGGLNFDQGFNDLTSVSELDGDNYVYMVANTTSNELKIIQGGPDNAIFVASGSYESPIFNAGYSASYNSFTATVNQPSATNIKMQVATAPAVSGSCTGATFNYVGPNGDSASYFTPSGTTITATIPFGNYNSNAYQNPGQCFRYKVWMTSSNQTQTPTLYDVSWNYSP